MICKMYDNRGYVDYVIIIVNCCENYDWHQNWDV